MPWDQIYWNHYGGGSANKGATDSSNAIDIRYGTTKGADSQTAFSFVGKRRKKIADWFQLFLRDDTNPYSYYAVSSVVKNEDTQYWTTHRSVLTYGWPSLNTYGGNVSAMKKSDLSADNGYPSQRDKSGDDDHSTLEDDLFQAQNRESCHHMSNVALSHNQANPFIGIHADYPLKLTTSDTYKGYRLILKRKRYVYDEHLVRMCPPNMTNQFASSDHNGDSQGYVDAYDQHHPFGACPCSYVYKVSSSIQNGRSGNTTDVSPDSVLGPNDASAFGTAVRSQLDHLFVTKIPRKGIKKARDRLWFRRKKGTGSKTSGKQDEKSLEFAADNPNPYNKEPGAKWADQTNRWSLPSDDIKSNPAHWADWRIVWVTDDWVNNNGKAAEPGTEDQDLNTIKVQDAVIHPSYNQRVQTHTGSVYLKNITIKIGGKVAKAEDDIIGKYQEVDSTAIYTDQSNPIKATGSKGQKKVTFSNLYGNKSNIIHRYIAKSFLIKFPGDATEYEIDSVDTAGNKITLKTNLSKTISNSSFVLHIPRGSQNSKYTWGNYKISNFNGESYDTTPCDEIENSGEMTTRDLFYSHSAIKTSNGNAKTFHQIMNRALEQSTTGRGDMADREPFFSNELTEALFYKKDFHHLAYHDRHWWQSFSGLLMHIGTKTKYSDDASTPSWNKCSWVKYYETIMSNFKGSWATHKSASGYTNLHTRNLTLNALTDRDLSLNEFAFEVKQFHYGGVDDISHALWPGYRNNIAQLNPGKFNQSFSTKFSKYGEEFTGAYGSGTSLAVELDKPWFVGVTTKRDVSHRAWMYWSGLNSWGTPKGIIEEWRTMSQLSRNSSNSASDIGGDWTKFLKHRCEKLMLHPWVLANYGFESDMLGWQGYLAGKKSGNWAYHTFTIYDTNKTIKRGTEIEVSLQQAASMLAQEWEDEYGVAERNPSHLGYGQSNRFVDNYQLFIVAK